jgi:molybdate transport repressor ModE-like protein
MDLVQLKYLVAIADAGSMTGAARTLGVTQPSVTMSLQKLEEELGTKLVVRARQGAFLTRTGEELLHHAKEVFALLSQAEQRIAGLEQGEVGAFVVGCHESLGAYFLPGFLNQFLAAAPGIEVTLWNGSSASVEDAVVERRIDLGLAVNPRPHPSLTIVRLFEDAMDLFVEASISPIATSSDNATSFARAADILRHGPLIFAARIGQCQTLLDLLANAYMLPGRMLSCGDLELVKSLAIAGVGVAMLPRRVAAYGQEGKLVRLHPEMPFIPDVISLIYRADMHRTKAAMRLKDALVAYGKTLAG